MNIDDLVAENERLRKQNEDLLQEVKAANNTIRRAKDINPVERPTFKRVVLLLIDACMTLRRVAGGWLLKLGTKVRRFKRLKEIWELLMVDDWSLSDIFPPEPERHYPHCTLKPRPILKTRSNAVAPSYGTTAPLGRNITSVYKL